MLQITLDKTGFPIVKVPALKLEISWLPFTKIQLEHYMTDTNNPSFDRAWYDEICQHNARISPHQMDIGRYAGVFVTAILPAEAKLIAKWMGYHYDLPTATEWKEIFDYFYTQPSLPNIDSVLAETKGINERAKMIIQNLDRLTLQDSHQLMDDNRTIADQFVMRLGIMEYVYESNHRRSYAGQGQPNRHFHPHVRMLPRDREETLAKRIKTTGASIKQYGFRLIKRG